MQYLAILGRQPKISLAELTSLFSSVKYLGGNLATFEATRQPSIDRLGGSVKLARPISDSPEKFLRHTYMGVPYAYILCLSINNHA